VELIESRAVRRGLAMLNPIWDPSIHTYSLCEDCSSRDHIAGKRD
jgi:hypothetical protein